MTIFIDWKRWNEGEHVATPSLVCILRRFGKDKIVPYIVANCVNRSGKAYDWECYLGRSNKSEYLVQTYDTVSLHDENLRKVKITREVFNPKTDFLFYAEGNNFRMPPSPYSGEEGEEMLGNISELFYVPGKVCGRTVCA